jgi:prepilin-type N-terminal cleavage/methylation domain-containing protein
MIAKVRQRSGGTGGFTLLELLVVIGLVALLAALLLPTFAAARRQEQVIHCASNLRQICAALHTYAIDNKGQFPDMTTPNTGGNLWDVPFSFTAAMRRQNVEFRTFLCPAMQASAADALKQYTEYNFFNIIYYSIWIPRLNGGTMIPPSPANPGPYILVSPAPTAPFAGPASLNDTSRGGNPIITDIMNSYAVTPPPAADADPSRANNGYNFLPSTNHADGDRLRGANEGYIDGHVEFHNGNEIHPYYFGNRWNWR